MEPTKPHPGPPGHLKDAALLRLVADRRPEALAELYDRFAPLLLPLARRILEQSEVARLIDAAPEGRNRVLLKLLYVSGVRVSELCSLKWCDALTRQEGGQITVFGKGGKTRTVLLKPKVWQQLLAIKDTIRRHGKHCGVVATSNENLLERREQGFSMLAVGLDGGLLLRSLSGALQVKAGMPVCALPRISAWMSCVPS